MNLSRTLASLHILSKIKASVHLFDELRNLCLRGKTLSFHTLLMLSFDVLIRQTFCRRHLAHCSIPCCAQIRSLKLGSPVAQILLELWTDLRETMHQYITHENDGQQNWGSGRSAQVEELEQR